MTLKRIALAATMVVVATTTAHAFEAAGDRMRAETSQVSKIWQPMLAQRGDTLWEVCEGLGVAWKPCLNEFVKANRPKFPARITRESDLFLNQGTQYMVPLAAGVSAEARVANAAPPSAAELRAALGDLNALNDKLGSFAAQFKELSEQTTAATAAASDASAAAAAASEKATQAARDASAAQSAAEKAATATALFDDRISDAETSVEAINEELTRLEGLIDTTTDAAAIKALRGEVATLGERLDGLQSADGGAVVDLGPLTARLNVLQTALNDKVGWSAFRWLIIVGVALALVVFAALFANDRRNHKLAKSIGHEPYTYKRRRLLKWKTWFHREEVQVEGHGLLREFHDTKNVLFGDDSPGDAGVVGWVNRSHTELYGDEESGKVGLVAKVAELETAIATKADQKDLDALAERVEVLERDMGGKFKLPHDFQEKLNELGDDEAISVEVTCLDGHKRRVELTKREGREIDWIDMVGVDKTDSHNRVDSLKAQNVARALARAIDEDWVIGLEKLRAVAA